MPDWVKEELLKEQGYTLCPLCCPEWTIWNNKCDECEVNLEFEKAMKEKREEVSEQWMI